MRVRRLPQMLEILKYILYKALIQTPQILRAVPERILAKKTVKIPSTII